MLENSVWNTYVDVMLPVCNLCVCCRMWSILQDMYWDWAWWMFTLRMRWGTYIQQQNPLLSKYVNAFMFYNTIVQYNKYVCACWHTHTHTLLCKAIMQDQCRLKYANWMTFTFVYNNNNNKVYFRQDVHIYT